MKRIMLCVLLLLSLAVYGVAVADTYVLDASSRSENVQKTGGCQKSFGNSNLGYWICTEHRFVYTSNTETALTSNPTHWDRSYHRGGILFYSKQNASCTISVVSVTAATCTTDEVRLERCSQCLMARLHTVSGTAGHKEETVAGYAATCTTPGLTEGKKCTVCGTTTVEQTTIPAKGHTEETIAGKDATCTAPGLTEGKKCTVCGTTTVAQTTIPAKGHSEETIPGKDATCTEPGLTEGKKCTVCGTTTVEQTEIPAKGHTEESIPGKEATCTETGLTEGKKCTVCGTTTVEQTEIPAKGHTEENIPGKEATCTETGLTEGKKCTVCGTTTVEQTEIPAKGHSEETIPGKDATCTAPGLTEGKKCTVCGTTTIEQTEIPAKDHTEETIPGKDATCTEPGLTEGKKCTVCGTTTVEQTEIPAKGHTTVTIPGKAPTCTESGLTEGKKCSVCGATLVAQSTIPAKGHTEEILPGKEATCTEPGLTEGKKCSVCGEILAAQTTISANGHSFWGTWSIAKNERHRRYCKRGCGQYTAVACEYLTAVVGEDTLTICPICGRYGDGEVAIQKQATIANPAASKPGTFIARAEVAPVEGNAECLAVITAVYEGNGHIVDLVKDAKPVTVTLPMPVEAPCRLVFASIDEQTQEHVLIPVEYTVENGNLVFTVDQLGMFLLIAE